MQRHRKRRVFGLLIVGIVAILVVGAVLAAFAPRPPGRIAVEYNPRGRDKEIYILAADGSSPPLQITKYEQDDSRPVWSSDGRHLAFLSSRDHLDLYGVDADGSQAKALTTGIDVRNMVWSPDGQQIAFTAVHPAVSADGEAQAIYLANADGSDLRQLTPDHTGSPTWSPDRQRIAFSSGTQTTDTISIINADGTGLTQLPIDGASGPLWSPDGQHIAFFRNNNGAFDLDVMHPDGSGVTPLMEQANLAVWSPNGQQLAVLSFGPLNHQTISLVNADGLGVHEVIANDQDYIGDGLTWSPDGQWIAFTVVPTSLVVSITEWPKLAYATVCMWLRLGCTPAYVQFQEVAVYAVRADGSNLTLVSQLPGASRAPAWQP